MAEVRIVDPDEAGNVIETHVRASSKSGDVLVP
jgi:hypothetical protein